MALGIGKKHLARVGAPRRTTWVVAILLVAATAAFGVSTAGADKAVPVATGAMVPAHKTDKCIGFSEDRYLELQNCTGSAAQVAELRHVTDGYFELAIGQDCAHIENYSSQKDARIVGSDCGLVQANMLWKPTSKGLTSKLVNYCMTVFHNSGHHGAPVVQDSCGGAWYQRYTIGGTSVEGLTDPTKPGNPPVVVTTTTTAAPTTTTTAAPTTTTTAAPASTTTTPDSITSTTIAAPTTTPTTASPTTAGPTTTKPVRTTTTAKPPVVVGQPKKVANYNTNLCMGHDEAGLAVALQDCESEQAAATSFAPVESDGYGQLRLGDRCLVSQSASRTEGVPVVLEDCATGPEALWVPAEWMWGGESTLLRNKLSGLCLQPDEWTAGAGMTQMLCNPNDERSQLWNAEFAAGMMGKDNKLVAPVAAASHGTLNFNSFHKGTYKMDSWTHGDIAFYAPPGKVTDEMAQRWMGWYAHMDALHRRVWNQDNFDSVYRAGDPNHGRKKVVAMIDEGLCSCGNKQQAEIFGFTSRILEEPEDWRHHWVMFYEMNRGGPTPNFYPRATWPNTHQGGLILPHMMAALAFYELGGPAGLERDVPGDFLLGLTNWRVEETKPLAELEIPADIQMGILVKILQDRGTDTFIETLHNMSEKPEATSATQALCDFRDAVNASTGGAYNSRMTNDWRLPTSC